MESMLYEAAKVGNVTSLLELIRQDGMILDRILVNYTAETPLHVAVMLGHTDFVKEIVRRKPELAREMDSRGWSPLHLASAKGYLEIVKTLLVAEPDMCFARDIEERNPLHLAAIKGQVEVLKELADARPRAADATLAWDETILHMCVKYRQVEALKLLLQLMDDDLEMVNAKDSYGMTVLHLAVAEKQIEIVNYLLLNTGIDVNAANANGFTALDILAQSRRGLRDFDIAETLRGAGALKAAEISSRGPRIQTVKDRVATVGARQIIRNPPPVECCNYDMQQTVEKEDWLTKKRDALMVVASLIATMAFQAGLTPPGGLWQDDDSTAGSGHEAGTSIMAKKNEGDYTQYLAWNTAGFIASLSIILLLITGLPFKRRFFMWVLTVIVWIAITSMALTYRVSILFSSPKEEELTVTRVLEYAVRVWYLVMALLLLAHTIRLTASLFKKLENVLGRRRRQPPLVYSNERTPMY